MISKLLLEVWGVLPKSNICVRSESVKSNSLQSRLRIVLRRVRLSLIKKGQWRKKWVADSISWPQLHKGFIVSWRLCLNLCYLKWLRPSLSLVISLIPLGLWISKTEFGEGRMKLSIFSLKTEILLEFLRLGSKLFHSIITDGKKEFLKKLCFVLITGIWLSVLVAYDVHLTGMR